MGVKPPSPSRMLKVANCPFQSQTHTDSWDWYDNYFPCCKTKLILGIVKEVVSLPLGLRALAGKGSVKMSLLTFREMYGWCNHF